MRKKFVYLNVILAGVLALALIAPTGRVFANSEITTVQANVTSVAPGGQITITGTVSSDVRYVWAMVGDTRVNGTLSTATGGQNFTIANVRPVRTGNIYVFANSENSTAGAASRAVYITILGIGTPTPPQPSPTPVAPQTPATPAAPAAPAAFRINNIAEGTPTAANRVTLLVDTGPQATHVWIRYGPGRQVVGGDIIDLILPATLESSTATSRRWIIDYPTSSQTPQGLVQHILHNPHSVSIISYADTAGGEPHVILGRAIANGHVQDFNVELRVPFTPPRNFTINNRSVVPRTVTLGNSVRLRVTTNQEVDAVWVRDMDDNVITARRIPPRTPDNVRHFEVFIRPSATGEITIFAGSEVGDSQARSVTENITVNLPSVVINDAITVRTGHYQTNDEATIRVTTNQHANSVWATLPDNSVIPLNMTSAVGATPRVWEASPAGVTNPNITVRATNAATNTGGVTQAINRFTPTLPATGTVTTAATPVSLTNFQPENLRRGVRTMVTFTLPDNVTQVFVWNTEHDMFAIARQSPGQTGSTRNWTAYITPPTITPGIQRIVLNITAFVGNTNTTHEQSITLSQ